MTEGLIAFASAIFGGLLVVGSDWIRRWYEEKQRAQYLAIRCVIAIDAFVSSCASALTHEPEAPPNEDPDDYFDLPEQFQIPSDVDWTSIPRELAYRILSIPQRDSAARDAVKFIRNVADGSQARESRDEDFIKLGLESAKIASELRRRYRLEKSIDSSWDPFKVLNDLKAARLKGAQVNEKAA